ncbi:MAG: hypothetical protein OXN89_27305 [Bryobacterales bacterium]|nr:hypothetical protein [Bryobacterales bacterium]
MNEANELMKRPYKNDPSDYQERLDSLRGEIERLNSLGPDTWTEYQILTLKQLLIDVLPTPELIARSDSVLEELREFAEGPAFSYDTEVYHRWKTKIDGKVLEIEKILKDRRRRLSSEAESHFRTTETAEIAGQGTAQDKETGQHFSVDDTQLSLEDHKRLLRASIKSAYEHVADYKANWCEGSTIVSSIRIAGSVAVIVFILLGVYPFLLAVPNTEGAPLPELDLLEWGFLGVAGAITNVLIQLRRADEVEVGNNQGDHELRRIQLGVPLGFVAGLLAYAAIASGLLGNGSLVPGDPEDSKPFLAIIWSLLAGLGMDRVFHHAQTFVDQHG